MSAAHAEKLRRQLRQLYALASDPGATISEADNARRAAARIVEKLRAMRAPVDLPADDQRDAVEYAKRAAPVAPGSGPTISVHWNVANRVTSHHVAARYWCPACTMGRNHLGDCPVCGHACEVTPQQRERIR